MSEGDPNGKHLREGGSVCQFAKVPPLRRKLPSLAGNGMQGALMESLKALSSAPRATALVLQPEDELLSHGDVNIYSKFVYRQLLLAAIENGGNTGQARIFSGLDNMLDPRFVVQSAMVFVPDGINILTFFSPHFDPRHPRFMPKPMGLITWQEDLARVEKDMPDVAENIRFKAVARVVLSMLSPNTKVTEAELMRELDQWSYVLEPAAQFFDDSNDPSLPNFDAKEMAGILRVRDEVLDKRSSINLALEGMLRKNVETVRGLPALKKVLSEHPKIGLVDLAYALFANHYSLYPKAMASFK